MEVVNRGVVGHLVGLESLFLSEFFKYLALSASAASVKTARQGTSDDAPNEGSVNKTCGADSLRVPPWPCSRPCLGPATRWLSRHRVSGLRSACIKLVQNIYIFLCVHGLRRAVCVNSPSAGLGLIVLPCAILIAVFCSSLFCLVLPPCCRLGFSAAPAGIPSGSGFCAYGKLLLFSLRCAPQGVSQMEKFVGIFARGCKNSLGLILQFSGSENSSGLWAVARLRSTSC